MSRVLVQADLLSGRYHAHPWGEAQHAMAGPEWPPSPWRLLRGLAAAWFDANPPPIQETVRDGVLEALARAAPPKLWLPTVSFAEIPYYQPIVEGKKQKRALHFDHFAVLAHNGEGTSFCFDFEAELSGKQREALARLLARMTYLGRAESRAHLSLVDAPPEGLRKVSPANDHASSGVGIRRRVLVTRGAFRAEDLWADGSGGSHLVQAMVEQGRRLPSNTRWLDYALPAVLIRPHLPRRHVAPSAESPRVAAVRFGLFRRIPILLSDAVPIARDIRDQAAKSFEDATGESSCRLTGREADGSIARGHQHAFWLPEPDAGTGYLHGVTVRLPDGADGIHARELDALLGIQRVFRDNEYPILVVAERVVPAWPEATPSRHWRSLTPFLAPLHSRRGRPDLVPGEQLRRMIEEIAGESPKVKASSGPSGLGTITPVRTHLYQSGRWRWTRRAAAWFELEFDREVFVPRPVGADAHFGLGQFVPGTSRTSSGSKRG